MESFKFHNLWKDWWERTSKHDVNLFSFFESWMKILRICLRVRRPEIPCSRVALCWRVHMIINKNCLLCINCPFTRFTELTDIRLEKKNCWNSYLLKHKTISRKTDEGNKVQKVILPQNWVIFGGGDVGVESKCYRFGSSGP